MTPAEIIRLTESFLQKQSKWPVGSTAVRAPQARAWRVLPTRAARAGVQLEFLRVLPAPVWPQGQAREPWAARLRRVQERVPTRRRTAEGKFPRTRTSQRPYSASSGKRRPAHPSG